MAGREVLTTDTRHSKGRDVPVTLYWKTLTDNMAKVTDSCKKHRKTINNVINGYKLDTRSTNILNGMLKTIDDLEKEATTLNNRNKTRSGEVVGGELTREYIYAINNFEHIQSRLGVVVVSSHIDEFKKFTRK